MFEHRKYHALYFILGVLIAFILVTALSGCERGTDSKGRACSAIAGMTWEGEACEVDIWIPEPPRNCCMAFMPSCMACQEGISVPEWMENTCGPIACDVEYAGWDDDLMEPIWMCQAIIIN